MGHHLGLQSHHANLQGQPMPFVQECHDRRRELDTKGNRDLVLRKTVLLKTVVMKTDSISLNGPRLLLKMSM